MQTTKYLSVDSWSPQRYESLTFRIEFKRIAACSNVLGAGVRKRNVDTVCVYEEEENMDTKTAHMLDTDQKCGWVRCKHKAERSRQRKPQENVVTNILRQELELRNKSKLQNSNTYLAQYKIICENIV